MEPEIHTTNSEEETIALGKTFADRLQVGDTVAFYGGLGAGKTEFVKGICEFFNVEDIVSSPTFTIINQYNGINNNEEITIYHVDLYRIETQKELDEIGFDDCMFSHHAIKLVEWSEKSAGLLPNHHYKVNFILDDSNENLRTIEITKHQAVAAEQEA